MKKEDIELLFQDNDKKIKITFSHWNSRPSFTIWENGTGRGYSSLLDAIDELPENAKFTGIIIKSTVEILAN